MDSQKVDLVKLVKPNLTTHGGQAWAIGRTVSVPVERRRPVLCTGGVLHAYRSLELALLVAPAHGYGNDAVVLAATSPEVVVDDGTKVGVYELTPTHRIERPAWWADGAVRRRVQVLVHGVPVARVQASLPARDDARASLGLAAADPVVVTIANLRATKDYPNLLRAAGTVARRVPGVRFFAAGQGPLADELRAEAASLGLGATFTFLGHVEDPLPLLAAADVFVLASRHEGLSIALLEAMTAGLPVVVTTVGAAPSVVTEGREGVLVPSGDPDALADAIVALLADPARRQSMGAAAAARAEAFDIVGAARQLEAVYRRVLSGS